MRKQQNIPGQRITSGYQKIVHLADKLHDAIHEIESDIHNDKDSIILLDMEKGKLVMRAVGPDGDMGCEEFSKAVDLLRDEADIRDLEKWAKAFTEASRELKARACLIRKNPEEYLMPSRRSVRTRKSI